MEAAYWSEFGATLFLSGFLIFYYADGRAPLYAKLLAFFSILCSLICFAILPIDIYESALDTSNHLASVQTAWKVVYYINFFACWFVLPFAQEYEDSGEFTFAKKLKDSLVMNGLLFGAIGIGAIIFLIVILVMGEYSFSQLPALVATIANAFGLTLVSVLLGYGLISFPKECFLRKDYKKIVNHCHRQAEAIQAEQQVILEEVYCIRKVLERSDQRYEERDNSQRREIKALI